MLSNDVLATPRARPPAQARRSVSLQLKHSPPPPYAAAFALKSTNPPLETLVGSPSVPPVRGRFFHSPQPSLNVEDLSWMKEQSREELTELLTKADNIIRERESQLSLTSAFCKSLYEDSVTIKSKHKALLAGIPGASAVSSTEFPSSSSSPVSHNASLPNDSLVDTPTPLRPPFHIRRTRKISVSPADIALLSDQNADLLQKLDKLETESKEADQVGRRALKRLEKEIQGLREELEMTQARSEELEEKTRKGFGKGVENAVEEVLKKKQEKIARFRALKGKGSDSDSEEDEELQVRDFAPGSGLPHAGWSDRRPWSPSKRSDVAGAPILNANDAKFSDVPTSHAGYGDEEEYYPSSLPQDLVNDACTPPQEYALISQLLLKIQELEETNIQIKLQQVETAAKLQSVQRDTEHITRLYECLGDPANVEWEVVVDGDRDKVKHAAADDTIRFRSLRRKLEGDLSKLTASTPHCADVFEGGIATKNRSTAHGNVPLNVNTYKKRKSVVGLFNTAPEPGVQQLSTAGNPGFSSSSQYPADSESVQKSWSTEGNSPALSALSLATTPRHTLGSELGSEFGDDWAVNAGNHHLRATSLGDLTDISRRSPSPMPAQLSSCLPGAEEPSDSSTALQLTFEAPTPERPTKFAHSESEAEQRTPRHRQMSQTIRSRTSRWVDRRFKDTLFASKPEQGEARPFPGKLGNAIDAAVECFIEGGQEKKPNIGKGLAALEGTSQKDIPHVESTTELPRKVEKKAAVAFVLELWLWLQFAIIILVFLWAMAKRGPKTLLDDAERKRRARD